MNLPVLPPHPLDHPGAVKILLGTAASEALTAAGDHFMVQATRSHEHGGRFVLIALPLHKDTLNAASRVALGKARAAPIRRKATRGDPEPSQQCKAS